MNKMKIASLWLLDDPRLHTAFPAHFVGFGSPTFGDGGKGESQELPHDKTRRLTSRNAQISLPLELPSGCCMGITLSQNVSRSLSSDVGQPSLTSFKCIIRGSSRARAVWEPSSCR